MIHVMCFSDRNSEAAIKGYDMRENHIKRFLQKNKIINRIVVLYKERERHVSFGDDNPDKTFFVIRRNAPNAGLFSFVITNVGWMRYATDHGYIPVIDMQSYYNTYITKDNIGKTNSWEYYFKQPCGYGMSDIAHSKNIIISSVNAAAKNPNPIDDSEFAKWHEYAHKYLTLTDKVQKEIDKKENELWGDKRILGVLCRGTDYISTKPLGHPVQPDILDVMDKVSDVMKKENCDAVYLATEDEMIFEKFRERFGDKLIAVSATRYKNTGDNNINEMSDRIIETSTDPAREKYNKGMDYAVTIGLLSRCNCLVAGQVSGTTGALLLTKGYDYVYLFDLGLYGDRE